MRPDPRVLDRMLEACRAGSRPAVPALVACLAAGPALALDAAGTPPPDRETLRRQWYRCVRQEFSDQPVAVGKSAAQRAALMACKTAEDAYVAAELTAELAARQSRDDEPERAGPTSRARAWIASMGSSLVDPIASWLGFKR